MANFEEERLDRQAYTEAKERVRLFVAGRKMAYSQVFNSENSFVKDVVKDLAKFCRANATTFHTDPRMHAVLEGRREVWLRIQQHLQLTPDELFKLLGGS